MSSQSALSWLSLSLTPQTALSLSLFLFNVTNGSLAVHAHCVNCVPVLPSCVQKRNQFGHTTRYAALV